MNPKAKFRHMTIFYKNANNAQKATEIHINPYPTFTDFGFSERTFR